MSMNYESCTLCPRMCGADRTKAPGFCGASHQIKAARAALHQPGQRRLVLRPADPGMGRHPGQPPCINRQDPRNNKLRR